MEKLNLLNYNFKKISLSVRNKLNIYLVMSIIGCIGIILLIILVGGFGVIWSRENKPTDFFAATLNSIGNMTLIYPSLYFLANRNLKSKAAIIIIVIFLIYALFSGTSTENLKNILMLVIIYILINSEYIKRYSILKNRKNIYVLMGVILVFTIFRFFRLLGTTIYFNNLADILNYFQNQSKLNPLFSFNEINVFAKAIDFLGSQSYLFGKSYLLIIVMLVPGILWPGKNLFIQLNRVDNFIPTKLHVFGTLWPMGYYGEAYINFGIIGVIFISILIGKIVRISENLILREKYFKFTLFLLGNFNYSKCNCFFQNGYNSTIIWTNYIYIYINFT